MARILLAEDDTSMRQFLTIALDKAGHNVVPCDNGLDALKYAQSAPGDIDLLLTDIIMPGIDGIELSKKITDINDAIKVVFITGFTGVSVNNDGTKEKQAQILSKPFHLNDLISQLDQVLTH